MGVFGACFGGAFKCNRRVDTFEKRHAFMQQVKILSKYFKRLIIINISEVTILFLGTRGNLSTCAHTTRVTLGLEQYSRVAETVFQIDEFKSTQYV